MRTSFNITLAESRIFKGLTGHIVSSNRLYFEWTSQYRRIVVVEDGAGFEVRVTYKGLAADCKPWATRWGVLSDAMAWAQVYADNKEVRINRLLTAKDFNGKRII